MILALLLQIATQPLPAPISQASQGQLQCYTPDRTRKTCKSLAGYRRNAQGAIINDSQVLINANPAVAMISSSVVRIRGERVCGAITAEDLAATTFVIDGRAAGEQQGAALLGQLTPAYAAVIDKEICTAYPADGDGLKAVATMAGSVMPNSEHVIWVSPSDGWKVAP